MKLIVQSYVNCNVLSTEMCSRYIYIHNLNNFDIIQFKIYQISKWKKEMYAKLAIFLQPKQGTDLQELLQKLTWGAQIKKDKSKRRKNWAWSVFYLITKNRPVNLTPIAPDLDNPPPLAGICNIFRPNLKRSRLQSEVSLTTCGKMWKN